jgi:hypothetical protein
VWQQLQQYLSYGPDSEQAHVPESFEDFRDLLMSILSHPPASKQQQQHPPASKQQHAAKIFDDFQDPFANIQSDRTDASAWQWWAKCGGSCASSCGGADSCWVQCRILTGSTAVELSWLVE